ncbi:iron chelate uptake ABC transporter family permease subunit [uncultured Fretibacterium sp.]|uniref:metal ABC transporter permease n=1 Tax=uncultured Fretibacterium sp. TaxID=1678694 RepID=UPI00262C7DF4|nr:iron chelate uptake ABC transporter family permease subunit [uncultured Fretibacterium sp.]
MNAFPLLHDYTFQVVALGAALLGMASGLIGSFAVLRRQSLLGDVVSHAALPGIAAVFLMTGTKDTVWLLIGALCSGLTATGFIIGVVRYSRVKFDTALALGMSVFFGLGLVLLTYVQKIPNSNQAGLQRFIFGQAAVLLKSDILVIAITGAVLLALTLLFWKEFKLLSFDPEFARSLGLPTRSLNVLLSAMTVAAIIAGLQTVGVILMSAMLVAPAVAARQWTNRLGVMVGLAALFGAVSGVAGTLASSALPKLPAGPAIVVAADVLVLISLALGRARSGRGRKGGAPGHVSRA